MNAIPEYRQLFGNVYPSIRTGEPITYDNFSAAIAEFEFSLTRANAPIDGFARGNTNAMTDAEKRGALLFFGKADCVSCHAVRGESNEMFSDFREHIIAVPQIAPSIGNVAFDGPGANEDFGLAQVTGRTSDRYAFRSSPLRNIALQNTFMHNGAFTRLEDAIRHHLDPVTSATTYSPAAAGVAADLRGPLGPIQSALDHLDGKLRNSKRLDAQDFADLVQFVRTGLLDPSTSQLPGLIPTRVPSGKPIHTFQ